MSNNRQNRNLLCTSIVVALFLQGCTLKHDLKVVNHCDFPIAIAVNGSEYGKPYKVTVGTVQKNVSQLFLKSITDYQKSKLSVFDPTSADTKFTSSISDQDSLILLQVDPLPEKKSQLSNPAKK